MRVALVTGGSRGIGAAIVEKLIKIGNKVFIWDILEPQVNTNFMKVDVSSFNEVMEKAKEVGDIDILVNNAGITKDKLLIRMEESDWDSVINVNLKGVFNCTRAFLPGMIKKRYGRIINISSVIGITGNPGQANYSAAKAGIIAFTKSVAKEVASRNITCNVIAPGYIETEMTKNLPPQVKEKYLSSIPMGRPGYPEEVANIVAFLISEETNYITGQIINIDGGMV